MKRRGLWLLTLLLIGVTFSSGWAQPAQPGPGQVPAPQMPGMMMPMMPMMGNMAQMVQLCTQMMNQMAGMMPPAQLPQPR